MVGKRGEKGQEGEKEKQHWVWQFQRSRFFVGLGADHCGCFLHAAGVPPPPCISYAKVPN